MGQVSRFLNIKIHITSALVSNTFPLNMCAPTSEPFSTTHTLTSIPLSTALFNARNAMYSKHLKR